MITCPRSAPPCARTAKKQTMPGGVRGDGLTIARIPIPWRGWSCPNGDGPGPRPSHSNSRSPLRSSWRLRGQGGT